MRTHLSREEILKFRQDRTNYIYGGTVYACKSDPYVILPKKIKWMGWTINMGHHDALATLMLIILWTTIPVLLVIFLFQNVLAIFIAVVIDTILLCAWCAKKAKLT